jgi:hypothetical protein
MIKIVLICSDEYEETDINEWLLSSSTDEYKIP